MRISISYVKGFFMLLIYCIAVVFCCVLFVRFVMIGAHFLNSGVFEINALDIRKTVIAGLVGGSFSAVGIWTLSFLENRKRNKG